MKTIIAADAPAVSPQVDYARLATILQKLRPMRIPAADEHTAETIFWQCCETLGADAPQVKLEDLTYSGAFWADIPGDHAWIAVNRQSACCWTEALFLMAHHLLTRRAAATSPILFSPFDAPYWQAAPQYYFHRRFVSFLLGDQLATYLPLCV